MKKFVCLVLVSFLIFPLLPFCPKAEAAKGSALPGETVPSKYSGDAFCFSFENESDFSDENLPIAASYDNCAENKKLTPGAGGSSAALHIRTESAVTVNGIVNNGVKNLSLIPGRTYRLSAWVKLLNSEIYKIPPNFNFFIMNAGTQLYEDENCTIPVETVSGRYNLVKITGADIGFLKADGTISGDWKMAETTFTMPAKLGKYYVKETEPVSCSMFLRVGSNEHSIKTISDYTDEFIASITDAEGNIDQNGFYSDYAIDDWCLEPFTEKAGAVKDASVTNSFETASWTSASGVRWTNTSAKAELEDTDGSAHAPGSAHALKLSYLGNPHGYMELSAHLDQSNSMIHNRAYKITFWAKASEALVRYFEEKPFYFKMIPERPSENRLERTKHMWAETLLKKKLSQNYEKFEILWYEPNNNMPGRDTENDTSVRLDFRIFDMPAASALKTETIDGREVTYAYSYENPSGNTVYADFSDFQVWFDEVSIEPMDIVLNGDMNIKSPQDVSYLSTWDSVCFAPGENNMLPGIFGAGKIVADETFSAASGIPCRNVLKLTKADGCPSQGVEVLNNTDYKISFWAKADSAESAGLSICPMFDRSITGPVRNSDVTELNAEGRLGYGSLTGETGDIPYYLYQGPQSRHKFTELKLNSGETLVYDDYFARMKSADGYEHQVTPTAWNFQFYNGSGWVSSNTEEVPQESESWRLTDGWKKYECTYRWDYEGGHYRLPKFKIVTAGAADFSLADIKIQRLNRLDDDIKVDNFHTNDTGAYLYAGNDLQIDYDFKALDKDVQEGSSVLKLLSGDENGNFAVIGMTYCRGGKTFLKIPDKLLGRRPGIELIPKSTSGEVGASYRMEFAQIVAGKVLSAVSIDGSAAAYQIESVFAPNFSKTQAEACLAFYGSDNRLLKTVFIPVPARTSQNELRGTVPSGGAAKVKLFVFESVSSMQPCCDSKSAILFSENYAPFEKQDEITVAFLGGSPMCGKGLQTPEVNSYSALVAEYFQDTYSDKTVHIINSAKDGSGTADGLLRAASVAAKQPDVVFIDFAADDGGKDMRGELTEMIELLCSGEKIPYIIFLYAADRNYSDLPRFYRMVSDKFHIPQIDLSCALRTHLNGDNPVSQGYLYDGIHPSAEGHIVYADAIIRALKTGTCYSKPNLN